MVRLHCLAVSFVHAFKKDADFEPKFAEKDPVALDVLLSFNAFATMIQVFKRFPLLAPIKYFFAPVKKLSSLAEMESNTRKTVLRRIERRGNTPHPDL